eukprot:6477916-Amphidinium_carterae.1
MISDVTPNAVIKTNSNVDDGCSGGTSGIFPYLRLWLADERESANCELMARSTTMMHSCGEP